MDIRNKETKALGIMPEASQVVLGCILQIQPGQKRAQRTMD